MLIRGVVPNYQPKDRESIRKKIKQMKIFKPYPANVENMVRS